MKERSTFGYSLRNFFHLLVVSIICDAIGNVLHGCVVDTRSIMFYLIFDVQ